MAPYMAAVERFGLPPFGMQYWVHVKVKATLNLQADHTRSDLFTVQLRAESSARYRYARTVVRIVQQKSLIQKMCIICHCSSSFFGAILWLHVSSLKLLSSISTADYFACR
jgi:hypothetical protein